ncbi:leucyl aminopeptidase [Kordiimonas marina]|uniref:leucyl aminopeptidase n=1 Tax=Kordiimonas marina TaxID=2872312 RepID=UPI001FF636F1|nr:leucyl aminopeptidase [Kordiimonas marina]MCJ9428934.1 leucyl aminopeptidase [Kordiimonas marina]
MQISFTGTALPSSGAAVFLVAKDKAFSGAAAEADAATSGALKKAADVSRFTGAKGQTLEVVAPAGLSVDRVLFIGLGDGDKMAETDSLTIGGTAVAKLLMAGSESATIFADADGVDAAVVAEGARLRSYRFDKYRTKETADKKPTLKAVAIATSDKNADDRYAVRDKVIDGVFLTRDLVSEPANVLYPESFAAAISKLSALGIDVEVLGEAEMTKLGMGSLLAVGQGSEKESKLAIMRWNGADKDDQPIAFVGKGVTFDTGGISLKPGEGMEQMKWDMGGAGTVTGLMKALAGRKAKVNAIGVVGLVENMPSGNAQRPGDVVTSMSGQTIEVLNTDAEGRLVLADALWYTQDRFKPKFMVDLATLTGAIIISLGNEHAGLFSDSDELAERIASAGTVTGDKVWRMPLHDNYNKMLDCAIADMKNIGGRPAGSITAAQFLKRFTNDVPWAHIDIAGMAWSDKDLAVCEKGGTGFGVRLLDRMVAEHYES